MNLRKAGKKGGASKSPQKRAAARANGAKGGRPSKAQALVRCMRVMHAKLAPHKLSIDAHDLDLIVERLCRPPGSGRRFFIRPRKGGGYGF